MPEAITQRPSLWQVYECYRTVNFVFIAHDNPTYQLTSKSKRDGFQIPSFAARSIEELHNMLKSINACTFKTPRNTNYFTSRTFVYVCMNQYILRTNIRWLRRGHSRLCSRLQPLLQTIDTVPAVELSHLWPSAQKWAQTTDWDTHHRIRIPHIDCVL